jgi:phage repressor protein C with HTH and peptisase S24 domain
LFRRRIGGVFVVVEDGLGEHAHKKLFSQKKNISLLDNNKD